MCKKVLIMIYSKYIIIKLDGFMSQIKPNIVFAFADDWGRYASAYKDQNSINEVTQSSRLIGAVSAFVTLDHSWLLLTKCFISTK